MQNLRVSRLARFLMGLVCAIFFVLPLHFPLLAQSVPAKKVIAIRVVGNQRTDESVFQRELSPVIGELFAEDYRHFAVNRLDRLGIFSSIKVTPVEEEDGIVLEIEVKETLSIMPSLSLSISDENGIQYGGGLKVLNLKGEAIFLSGKAMFGGATNAEFRLVNPWINGDKLAYSLDFYYRNRRNEVFGFQENAFELYTTFLRQHNLRLNSGGRLNLQYLKSDVPGKTISSGNSDLAPSISGFLGYDSRDSWSNPRSGWWNEIEVQRVGFLFGDTNFWRVNLDARRFQPLAPHQTLALFSLLTLTTGTVGRDIAVWQQFSVGGSNSIRGWELGERTGKNQFLNTVEYRYNFLEPRTLKIFGLSFYIGAQVAAFADLGCVWNDRQGFRPGTFLGGAGVGLRLIVPYIGLTRFDLAWGQPGMSIRLCLGSYEKPVRQRERVR
jgi:outer membrane protein insertion porin family